MGQMLHGSARTTEAVRRAIQPSQENLRVLAKRYGKWKQCIGASAAGAMQASGSGCSTR